MKIIELVTYLRPYQFAARTLPDEYYVGDLFQLYYTVDDSSNLFRRLFPKRIEIGSFWATKDSFVQLSSQALRKHGIYDQVLNDLIEVASAYHEYRGEKVEPKIEVYHGTKGID